MDMRSEIIINRYSGGLGNQMFQYAFGLNLEKQGKNVIADISWYISNIPFREDFHLEKVFPMVHIYRDDETVKALNKRLANRGIGTKIINRVFPKTHYIYLERNEFAYDEKALQTKKEVVQGYWQCYKYVENVSNELRGQLIFSDDLSPKIKRLLEQIEKGNSVFVHLRGGDYVKEPHIYKLYGDICSKDYYRRAVTEIKNKIENPSFWVFTNDKEYAKSVIGKEDVNFITDFVKEPYEDWIDLMLMSKCRHAIIANSSFSWWGAWLMENEDKIVIAPKKWMNRNCDFDIWEPGWVKL